MIDPLGVPIIFSLAGIDPPGVPVKPFIEGELTRRAYTFLELPIYLRHLLRVRQMHKRGARPRQRFAAECCVDLDATATSRRARYFARNN